MALLGEIGRRLAMLLRRRHFDRDLDEEMQLHLDLKAARNERHGADPNDARTSAGREFGPVLRLREDSRNAWGWRWLDDGLHDVRYASRTLARNPGFTFVAILTLALGIGANSAIFSVVNGVLLRPLPYKDSDRIVHLAGNAPNIRLPGLAAVISVGELPAWKDAATLTDISVYSFPRAVTLDLRDGPLRITRATLSPSTFALLDVRPFLGRVFEPDEDKPGADAVAVLSYAAWQRYFNADPSVLGRTLNLDGTGYSVVGVMPKTFAFPAQTDVWTPFTLSNPNRTTLPIARVKQGVSIQAATEEANAIELRQLLPRLSPERAAQAQARQQIMLISMKERLVADIRPALLVLLAAVGFVLLIACSNVASLLLARAASRRQEIAVRVALGAGRGRLIRQVMTESLMLALAGGVIGNAIAFGSLQGLTQLSLANIPRLDEVRIDTTVLAFTLAASVITGLLFGSVPAWQLARATPMQGIKSDPATDARSRSGLLGRSSGRHILTVVEVAMAMMLLAGAGLLIRSFVNLARVDLGYTPDHVLSFQIALPQSRYAGSARLGFYNDLLNQLQLLPDVRSAAIGQVLPTNAAGGVSVGVRPPNAQESTGVNIYGINRSYFDAIGARLEGRGFGDDDGASQTRTIVISQALARQFFKDENPLRKTIVLGGPMGAAPWEVVGLAPDVHRRGPSEDLTLDAYVDLRQWPSSAGAAISGPMSFVLRTAGDPTATLPAVRSIVHQLDGQVFIDKVASLDQLVADSVAQPRSYATLVGLFAGIAAVLAAMGIYGLIAYAVSQRTREIGIRMAIGAGRTQILMLILRQGLVLASIGIAIGLGGAMAVTRYLDTMLFGLTALDPGTFVAAAVVFAIVAALASYLPARRATRVDPLKALRCE